MQFKVPQNVQMEDKIVGPLTLKQLIIIGAGGGVAYLVHAILSRAYYWELWAPPVFIIALLTLIVAFVKIYNLSFGKFMLLFIEHNLLPRQRKWVKASGDIPLKKPIEIPSKKKKRPQEKSQEALDSINKLDQISKKLDDYSDKIESMQRENSKK